MIGPFLSAALVAGALASTSTGADSVRLHLGPCVLDRDMVYDLVGIEIGFERIIDRGATQAAFEVFVVCEHGGVRVRLAPNPYGVQERRVSADDVKEQGSRLIALNVVELIQDGAAQRSAGRTAAVVPAEPLLEGGAELPAPLSIEARLGASPTLRLLRKPGRLAVGARANFGVDLPVTGALAVTFLFDAGFEQSDAKVALGAVRARVLSTSLSAGARVDLSSSFSFFALLGARGGWGWLRGESGGAERIELGSGDGPWWGPLVGLRLRYGGAFGVTAGVEGGWTVYRLYGDAGQGEEVGLQSGWFGADLALDWSFGDG